MDSSKVFEKIKKIQNCKNAQDRTENCANFFWTCFVAIFLKKECPVFHGGSGLRKNLKKNQKILKIPKKPKTFPKVCKHVLNMFWGNFFPQTFAQCSMEGRVFKKFQKSKKAQKSFAKVFNHVLNMFWGDFFENVFCPVFHGGSGLRKFSKKSKKFKNPKKPKIVSKSVHTCFEHALGDVFENFLPSVPCSAFQIFWT